MSTSQPHTNPSPGSTRSGRWGIVVRSAVAISIVTALFLRVDWSRIKGHAYDLDAVSLALATVFFVAIAGIESARLVVAFPTVSFSRCFRIHLVGSFFGAFLPGQLGGDVYKIAVFKNSAGGIGPATSMIFLVRLSGILVMAAAALPAAVVLIPDFAPTLTVGSLLELNVVAVALAALVAATLLIIRAFPSLTNRMRHELTAAVAALRQVRLRTAGELLLLSVVTLGLRGGTLKFLTASAGTGIGWMECIAAASLIAMVTALPVSIAGLGLREGSVALLLTTLGVNYESAILVALLGRALMIALAGIGGMIAWMTPSLLKSGRAG